MPNQIEQAIAEVYRASLEGDVTRLVHGLSVVEMQESHDAINHLQDLSLQLLLRNEFMVQRDHLAELAASRSEWRDVTEDEGTISQHIERLRGSIDNVLETDQSEVAHETIAAALITGALKPARIPDALEGVTPGRDWLVSRARLTRDSVTECLWDIVQEVAEFRAESSKKDYPEWLVEEIENQLRIARENLDEAINGLAIQEDGVEQ